MTDLTPARARALTDTTRTHGLAFADGIVELYLGNADKALGYTGRRAWLDYFEAEFDGLPRVTRSERPALVERLSDAGMSTREIGAAVGADAHTVRRASGANAPPRVATEPPLNARIQQANAHIDAYLPVIREFNAEFGRRHLRPSLMTTGRTRTDAVRAFQALQGSLTQVLESLTMTRTESDTNNE